MGAASQDCLKNYTSFRQFLERFPQNPQASFVRGAAGVSLLARSGHAGRGAWQTRCAIHRVYERLLLRMAEVRSIIKRRTVSLLSLL
jgi:hypothetical protein